MANIWRKHSFKLLLYLEWILIAIALLTAFGGLIRHRHHHWISQPTWLNIMGIVSIAILGMMGLRQPHDSKLLQRLYIFGGFCLCWLSTISIRGGEKILPILLLVIAIRACLLFSWQGRILVAAIAYFSFLIVQILSFLRIDPWGIPLGRRLPPIMRRLPPDELRRVLFGLAFNSALMFAFVLAFVLLLVGAVVAEHKSRAKLIVANRRLREYAIAIEDRATLEERNRIAREIHDSVGHYLTAQSIQLENTALFLTKNSTKAERHLAKARELGREALSNIRDSVATLRQPTNLKQSLKIAIEKLVAEFKSNTDLAIDSEIQLISTLPKEIDMALYRILQESLTNIAKHSQASKVQLCLVQTHQRVTLSIKDNGCGFNPQENTTGFGLQGIKERTEALGGTFQIDSRHSQGCAIVVSIFIS